MLVLRRLWLVLVGACSAAALTHTVLDWVLGLEGGWVDVVVLLAASLGAVLSIPDARRLEWSSAQEQRDLLLGWATALGAIASLACLLLAMPWGAIAAFVVLGVTAGVIERASSPPDR